MQLRQSDGLIERNDASRSWGTWLTVKTLEDVSARLAWELPHAEPLFIGDISHRGGGSMHGHITHDLGIDVDLGLYLRGGRQPPTGFQDIQPRELDREATWATIRALLDTGNIQFILLDQDLIEVMREYVLTEVGLDHAEVDAIFAKPGERPDWRSRGMVSHAPNHRSHLHVRIVAPDDVAPVN